MTKELVMSKSKYVRVSPRKVAITLDLVRGKKYEEAVRLLTFTNNKPAKLILKTLKSAGSNAETNESIKAKDTVIATAYVGAGPSLKRGNIVARGRTNPILKRSSHIVIGLQKAN